MSSFVLPKLWDREVDVLVLGYGYSGACAAIYARDAGAKEVMILEKTWHMGGYSILSGGVIIGGSNHHEMLEYFKALCSGRTTEEVIEAQVKGLTEVHDYVRQLCKLNGATFKVVEKSGASERAIFENVGKSGASNDGKLISEKVSAACYPLTGGESLVTGLITEIPGFEGYPWLQSNYPGGLLMKVLEDNVVARGVEVCYSCPAQELYSTPEGEVIGVKAVDDSSGREINIMARKAVIIATGGFEAEEWMKLQFCEVKPLYNMGPPTNTGDGIKMAQKAGAALWHMWHIHGSYGFKFPEYEIAFRTILGGYRIPTRKLPWILVDKIKGQRFMNEFHPAPQDTMHRPLEYFDPEIQDFPRVPAWMVFDEKGRKMGPIAKPLTAYPEHSYNWSVDNNKEIERGWIAKADTVAELAKKIGLPVENLEKTLARWEQHFKELKDIDYGRPPGTMVPIHTPPYYAVQVWPIVTNTQGGPEHNAQQQVLDVFGKPIPRLYAVGECGSFYGHLYQLAGNISECIISGKIAGEKAAKE